MNGKRNKLIAVLICSLICLSASAYKFVTFSDLDSLMKRSDLIVLAGIAHPIYGQEQPRVLMRDGLFESDVNVFYSIKGSLSQDRHCIILQRSFIRKYHNFRLNGDHAMLFLTNQNSVDGEKVLMNWSNSGSIMPASPDLDIEKLKGLSKKAQVLFVLKDYMEYKKKELKAIKVDISKIK